MCDPITALTVGMGALNFIGGKAQESQANKTNAAALQNSYAQEGEKQKQINDQSALDQTERIKQGLIERGHIAAIAGESGALGFSSDRLVGDSLMQQGTDISSLEKNRQNAIAQTAWEAKQAQANSGVAAAKIAAAAPSLIGTGLQIGGDIYKANSAAKAAAKTKANV